MTRETTILRRLADELLNRDEKRGFHELLTALIGESMPDDAFEKIITFDDTLSGPSINRLRRVLYAIADRDVFRPLQYCDMYMGMGLGSHEPEWLTRAIVQASGVHIESLVKRIGSVGKLPLGTALRKPLVQRRLDSVTYDHIDRFAGIYNAAKHDMDHPINTHLFSVEDAVTAYIISRKLGMILYPLARLTTNLHNYDRQQAAVNLT